MHRRIPALAFLFALSGALLMACGDDEGGEGGTGLPIDVTSATLSVNGNIRAALLNGASSLQSLGESDVLASLPFGGEECAGSVGGEITCNDVPLDFDMTEEAGEAADWLRDNIFNAANVVDETSTSVTYQIPASLFCEVEQEPTLPDEPAAAPELDPDCVELFTEVPFRLRVRSPREGDVDVELLVGSDNPADFRLYANELAVEIDLAEVRDAIVRVFAASGEQVEGLPDVMRGRIGLSLSELSSTHAVASLAILSAIQVSSSGEYAYDVSLGAANPALRIELDAAAMTLEGAVDVGAAEATLPTAMIFGSSMECDFSGNCTESQNGTFELHVAGVSGSTSLGGASDSLDFEDVSLGGETSWAAIDGQRIVAIDLNPGSGRAVDVSVAAVASGVEVTVAPGLELRVALDMRHALAYGVSEMAEWLLDEDLALLLVGGAAPKVAFLELEDGTSFLQVVEGALELTSSALDLAIYASAGDCLWADDTATELQDEAHPFENLLSGACPE